MFLTLSSGILFHILETIGIFSFFISGALLAKKKGFDPVGIYVIGFVTALGGGTVRDILLDRHPLYWIQHSEYPLLFFLITGIVYFTRFSVRPQVLLWPDALGIATFGVTATQLGLNSELPLVIVAIIAVVSACFGGVLRDLLCTQTPMIFQQENMYATVILTGSLLYMSLDALSIDRSYNSMICIVFMAIFRLLAVRYSWRFK